MASPIIKWVGGKTRLLGELSRRLPLHFGRYFEPFAGGAALALDLAPERFVLGDLNADLIAMYRAVAEDVEGVSDLLEHLAVDHSEERYYQIRADWNAHAWATDPPAQAAAMLYLSGACFNGLWRVNRSGAMNAPIGRDSAGRLYGADRLCNRERLRAAARVLQRAELRVGDYRDTVRDAARGDLVYLDPPYDPVSDTASHTAYTRGGFGPNDQRAVGALVRELAARGVHVVVSNSDTPLVREIYDGLRIDALGCDRRVAARASSRKRVGEVLVVAFPHAVTAAMTGPQLDLLAASASSSFPAGQVRR